MGERFPGKSVAIIEGRDALGGTWDLFRYPGVRSDSDIFTLGYSFKPWKGRRSIVGGPAILDYLRETAREHGIARRIRFGHRLTRAAWDSDSGAWTVEISRNHGQPPQTLRCKFLFMCTGYYSYAQAHRPDFAGEAEFEGRIVHPQFWPADLDFRGKRVVVVGSGATAVTLVPAMAGAAAGVTMLQRSPTWMVSRASRDWLSNALRAVLPARLGYRIARGKFIARDMFFYQLATRLPRLAGGLLLCLLRWDLGPRANIARDFTPRYPPWDQRLCLVPDGDLFDCLKEGSACIETGVIERITATGIRLQSGKELPADIIVTATGLEMELMGGVELVVDGAPVRLSETMAYKGCMYSDIPNLASCFGYSNASWTLKAELICNFVCRVIGELDATGARYCVPRAVGVSTGPGSLLNLKSGYVSRALARLPKQGGSAPWKSLHNYFLDSWLLRFGRLDDGALQFIRQDAPGGPGIQAAPAPPSTSAT